MSINPIIGGIGIAGIFAALVSTVAGILFGCASIMSKDIWQRWLHPDTDDKYLARWTRLWILIIGVTSAFGAMTLPKILHQAFFVYSIRAALMICVAFGLVVEGCTSRCCILEPYSSACWRDYVSV